MHFLRDLVFGSHCSGCLGVADVQNLDSSGDDFLRRSNALFYSGYMLCVSSLAMDEFHTCFYDAADSNPGASSPFGRMEKCAQLMLLVAVLLRAVRTWKSGRSFRVPRG